MKDFQIDENALTRLAQYLRSMYEDISECDECWYERVEHKASRDQCEVWDVDGYEDFKKINRIKEDLEGLIQMLWGPALLGNDLMDAFTKDHLLAILKGEESVYSIELITQK